MKRSFQICACLVTALYLLGGHWGMLQMVAWSQMLRDYSRTEDVFTALKFTFDGEHPCEMCLKIELGRQQEQKDQSSKPICQLEKNSFLFAINSHSELPVICWIPHPSFSGFITAPQIESQCSYMPDTPPPKEV